MSNNIKDMPYKFDCWGSVWGYDYRVHKWVYDVKYYLNGSNWCLDPEGKLILREITERELKTIERLKDIVNTHERENAAWLNHKRCRKRNCVCKKCDKHCHCYDCVDKVSVCDNFSKGLV